MRVSGIVMVDEAGKPLAVSVGGGQTLAKSLAPESRAELVDEHKRLVGVLRSPSHEDDLAEADKQEAELAEYEGEMTKAHVKGYTRKDGTFVKEHDDARPGAQAAQPASAGKPGGDEFGHPHVVGSAEVSGNRRMANFLGSPYHATGKTGQSMHDDEPVHEFESEDGHRVWIDSADRVHADSTTEVDALREKFKKHAGGKQEPAQPQPHNDSDEEGQYEREQYGKYLKPGTKVKDNTGGQHVVLQHRGPEVVTEGGKRFHPSKVHEVKDAAAAAPAKPAAKPAAKPKPKGALGKNAVAKIGKIASNHFGFDTLDEVQSDREDFKETARWNWEHGLRAAHRAGYLDAAGTASMDPTHESYGSHEEIEALAKKHGPFSDLATRNSGEDFKEAGKLDVRNALEEAYRSGHAKGTKGAAKKGNGEMRKSIFLVSADLMKAHVASYTRKDGTFVKEHETKVPASSVSVDGALNYQSTHGKKPGGRGTWLFSPHQNHDFGAHGSTAGEHFYQSGNNDTYAEAKDKAKQWAASRGIRVIHLQT